MLYRGCVKLGVKFHLGDAVNGLIWADGRKSCLGARTASGKTFKATRTIVTLGAWTASIVPALFSQVQASGFPVAHVQLLPEEAARLRGIPVTYARDIVFFFEPDPDTNLLKLCNSGANYTNNITIPIGRTSQTASIAPAAIQDSAFITDIDENAIRKLLRETLPDLADRPLVKKSICWCADSANADFLIDNVPGTDGLIVVSGDSGHGFKMLPIVGLWVKEVLEYGSQKVDRWKWKSKTDVAAGDVIWRVAVKRDLKDVRPAMARL
jgi:sarcosine oxidase / L-pipecolate oxidase